MAIRPGDDFDDNFGSPKRIKTKPKQRRTSLKKSRKQSTSAHPQDDSGFYGFDDIGTGSLCNPFGDEIQDYDVRVSWDALSALSEEGRINPEDFEQWINEYLQLNWNEPRIKRAWNQLDTNKAKYITFKEFRSGLKSTNYDLMQFYSNLMV